MPETCVDAKFTQLLSTTTSIGKVRGFSILILHVLRGRLMLASEIADLLDKKNGYVWTYLIRLRRYGLLERKGQFWTLTSLGASLIDRVKKIKELKRKRRLMKTAYIPTEKQQKKNRKTTGHLQKINTSESKKKEKLSIELWLKNSDGNYQHAEKKVVEYLLSHYNQTGSKFIYLEDVYALAEKINREPKTVRDAIRNLKQDKIVYIWRDKSLSCWKIGLYKSFIEKLKILLDEEKSNLIKQKRRKTTD